MSLQLPWLPVPLPALLVVAYLALVAAVVIQYRRGEIGGRRLFALVGMALCWLSYATVRVGDAVARLPGAVVAVVAGGALVAGLGSIAYGWRRYPADGA